MKVYHEKELVDVCRRGAFILSGTLNYMQENEEVQLYLLQTLLSPLIKHAISGITVREQCSIHVTAFRQDTTIQ